MHLRAPGLTRHVLDVPVAEGPVPDPWAATIDLSPHCWAETDRLRFESHGVAIHVSADEVTIDAPTPASRAELDWLLYATATRAMLTFRGRHNVHATLVLPPGGGAVAIVGEGTAGKSTTTVELVRRGWGFACDDIVEVRLDPSVPGAAPVAVPIARPLHLSDAAAGLLGGDPAVGRPVPGTDKRVYAADGDLTPRALRGLVVLGKADVDAVTSDRADPLSAIPSIAHVADRYGIERLPERRRDFHEWVAALCSAVPVHVVRRPPEGNTVTEVADAVERAVAAF